ncbi:type VI secretion system baseplate subunit TssF [Oceaniglobus trochenteri]|uniref:type VI secretion system baseplate subunit TssF n=1 Tax=Oceaniglobus trochenteri TaxID=2763260 RepID=UPI001CFF7E3D|nr:type VI secretion system baseplate subunit TssF [Oceaniglobus trochenteri]
MDTRLLRHYENELSFLREMGGEFAQSYPKIAARLGMDGTEVLDPYVERLLEGTAFLTARVQLELELQYPAFTNHLLDIVYPQLMAPTPSMMIAQLAPDLASGALAAGADLPRGTQLRSVAAEGTQTACVFTTAHDLTMWPVEFSEAEYIDGRGELVAAGVVAPGVEARAAIRLRLRRPGGAPLGDLPLERLTVFMGGNPGVGWKLHELLCGDCSAVVARGTDRRADWVMPLVGGIEQRGLSRGDALLPTPRRSLDAYRLLQEYFALPDRFYFADICGLDRAMARSDGDEIDLYILLRNGNADVAANVTQEAFKLNCVPAINLFEKRCDRVLISVADSEQHVIADRTAPLDYELITLLSVTGISGKGDDDLPFRPFYSATEFTAAGGGATAFYSQSRKMRQRTERERLKGTRTNYLGSELYVTLVDMAQAPWPEGLTQLAVKAMVSNRDLPMLLPTGARDVFHLPGGGPVAHITTPVPPTRPRPTLAQGESAWKLISNLSLNYLSLVDSENGTGAEAMRELIGLYAPTGDRAVTKQLEGITAIDSRPIVRRMSDGMLSTAVRGLEIAVTCDEDYFEGAGPFLLATVLQRFFANYVSLNSFTETVLKTPQRGEVARWRPEKGLGTIL